jgi:hypothetical protein
MINKAFKDITFEDIASLITNGVSESQNLEFKKEVWRRDDRAIKDMLKDISAMANAYGGILIIGMTEDEDTGQATEIINVPDAEDERDRILSSCLTNLQPRIIGIDIRVLGDDKKILLVHVPNSSTIHQIIFAHLYQFWFRHDRQQSVMTYNELRDKFTSEQITQSSLKELINSRYNLNKRQGKTQLVLRAFPLVNKTNLNLKDEGIRDILKFSSLDRPNGWTFNFSTAIAKPTINGVMVGGGTRKTLELFRSGYIEGIIEDADGLMSETVRNFIATDGTQHMQAEILTGLAVIEYTLSFCNRVQSINSHLGQDTQYAIGIELHRVSSYYLPESGLRGSQYHVKRWDEEEIIIDPIVLDTMDPVKITKELGDRVWQAFGFEEEPFYKEGNFDFSV